MSHSPPFTIEVFDGFTRKGWIGNPVSVVATPRHNAQPSASITVESDHHRLADLTGDRARVALRYNGAFLMSGKVRLRSGTGPAAQGMVTVQVIDDWRLLSRVLGWPVPGAALTAQSSEYNRRTGAAETVLKGFVSANAVTRLGLPVTVAADQARGSSVDVSIRFHPLADRLLPVVDQAGIGVTVQQQGAALVVDCYTPRTYPRTLTEASGVVREWEWSKADPDATRVVAGGGGEGAARAFRQIVDSAREAQYGDVIEVFRDANDVSQDEVGWESRLDARAQETLDEGAPKSGLSVKLAETTTFRYDPTGTSGIRVGDRVAVEVGSGVVINDVLREATISWTRENGLEATPVIGQRSDDPDRVLAAAVARLARGVRNLTTR